MTGDPFHPLGGKLFGFSDWHAGDYASQLNDIKANFGWPPAYLLLAVAAPLLALRSTASPRIWATVAFSVYAMLVWNFTSHYPRYLLPAYPALCVLAAAVLASGLSGAWTQLERGRLAFLRRGYAWRAVQFMVLLAAVVLAERRYHHHSGYEWSLVSPTQAERQEVLKGNLPRYAGVISFLREHPARGIYQLNLEAVLYYLPRPVRGDHFGRWRYLDYRTLSPQALAERMESEGLDTLVVSLYENRSLTSSDLARHFERVYADSDMHVYKIRARVR